MITQKLISTIRDFAKIDGPMETHQLVANEAGQKIAENLRANKDIVLLGTLLMDCVIGIAIKENRMSDHVAMCHQIAKELLDNDPDINLEEKENVLSCVLEHHGVPKFSTLESEIVCNADCYRFASIKGTFLFFRYFRQMPDIELISLINVKYLEKKSAITLNLVKEELKEQFPVIENYINLLSINYK